MACSCGGRTATLGFAGNFVEVCSNCHRLKVDPLYDPRIPSFQDHVRVLKEEIMLQQEEENKKQLGLTVQAADSGPTGARLRCQIVEGDARWIVAGSRGDVSLDDERFNGYVYQKARDTIMLDVDKPEWKDLALGTLITLRPVSTATLYRNLLQAFLAALRKHEGLADMLRPENIPSIPRGTVSCDDKGLRPRQKDALQAALKIPENGTLLVQGPPGTGKTHVIARLVKEAVKAGWKVLVTSGTHVAIDNAMRKALRQSPGLDGRMVRLGDAKNLSADMMRIHGQIGAYHMDPEEEDAVGVFGKLQQEHDVVGMTLDALACAYLVAERLDQDIPPFDLVIVDEAGMNGFPKTILAHAVAKRLLLVGDPLQLPPIVRAYGADDNHRRSHFETLQLMRPDLAVMLNEQFRCHPDIYDWSKSAVYSDEVTSQRVPEAHHYKVRGNKVGPVVWLPSTAPDKRVGTSRRNNAHIELVVELLKDFKRQGVQPEDIGYISPFRSQAEALKERLEEEKRMPALAHVTCATVDAFQGNERKIIIFDLTTRKPAKPHEDHRRLNVSLTRAEDLLVIIGPKDMVQEPKHNPFLWSLQNWQKPELLN